MKRGSKLMAALGITAGVVGIAAAPSPRSAPPSVYEIRSEHLLLPDGGPDAWPTPDPAVESLKHAAAAPAAPAPDPRPPAAEAAESSLATQPEPDPAADARAGNPEATDPDPATPTSGTVE